MSHISQVQAYRQQGIIFFVVHPFLYPLLRARLLPAFFLSAFILLNLFFWTLLPQVAFLALFHRTGSAWVNGTFLVLGEGAAIVALLFESFLVVCILGILNIARRTMCWYQSVQAQQNIPNLAIG